MDLVYSDPDDSEPDDSHEPDHTTALVPADDPALEAFDEAYEAELAEALADRSEILPSSGVQKFRRNSAMGVVLNGVALGLREVLEVPREEAPIVQEASGEPDTPRHVDAHLDPDDPAASSVTVRPWLSPSNK